MQETTAADQKDNTTRQSGQGHSAWQGTPRTLSQMASARRMRDDGTPSRASQDAAPSQQRQATRPRTFSQLASINSLREHGSPVTLSQMAAGNTQREGHVQDSLSQLASARPRGDHAPPVRLSQIAEENSQREAACSQRASQCGSASTQRQERPRTLSQMASATAQRDYDSPSRRSQHLESTRNAGHSTPRRLFQIPEADMQPSPATGIFAHGFDDDDDVQGKPSTEAVAPASKVGISSTNFRLPRKPAAAFFRDDNTGETDELDQLPTELGRLVTTKDEAGH